MTSDRFVKPVVFQIGEPQLLMDGLSDYLDHIGVPGFMDTVYAARDLGVSDAEIICSIFSKLCYKSFDTSRNVNLSKVRDIPDNVINCFETGHGSVFEHVMFNFIVSDCSRVFTHELVRHRVGVAFSQTSGRYCRLDTIPLVLDPMLDPVREQWDRHLKMTEDLVYFTECKLGLRVPPASDSSLSISDSMAGRLWVANDKMPFDQKKKLTSAIRRIAPNGQANEVGVSLNLRSLRHTMLMRTARVAEWEIRLVFSTIYEQLKSSYPLIFYGAKEKLIDGIVEVSGLKCQPYEKAATVVLEELSDEELELYLRTRPNARRNNA